MTIRPASEWASGAPGLFADVPDADYFAYPAVSNSLLSGKTPAHMRAFLAGEKRVTPAMLRGTAYHTGVLRPMEYIAAYAVAQPCSATLKSGEPCTSGGKTRHGGKWFCGKHTPDAPADTVATISAEDHDGIMAASEALRRAPVVRALLGLTGGFEVAIRWDEDGIVCKAKVDFVAPGDGVAIDYKTTRDASPQGFARAAANLRYNRQQAWYVRGLETLGVPIYDFLFIAQETDAPYACGVYRIPQAAVDAGMAEAGQRLVEYVRAKTTDVWPAYADSDVIELEWPAWADLEYTQEEEYHAR